MFELSFVSDIHPNSLLPHANSSIGTNSTDTIPTDTFIGPSTYILYAIIYGCGGLYLMPSIMSWSRMWLNRYSDTTAVKLFFLIGFGSAIRAVAFLLVSIWMIELVQANDTPEAAIHLHLSYKQLVIVWEILSIVGSLFMAGVFLLVFATWAGMIDRVTSTIGPYFNETGWFRDLFVKINIVFYLLQGITFLAFTYSERTYFSQCMYLLATIAVGLVSSVCIFLMPAYGTRMCALLGKVGESAERRKRNIRRIALISSVFFMMRVISEFVLGCSLYYSMWIEDKDANDPSYHHHYHQPSSLHSLLKDNPIFFLNGNDELGQHWLVFLQVVEFPVEWGILMALLYVLPSHTVLPTMRGYTPIPERRV